MPDKQMESKTSIHFLKDLLTFFKSVGVLPVCLCATRIWYPQRPAVTALSHHVSLKLAACILSVLNNKKKLGVTY